MTMYNLFTMKPVVPAVLEVGARVRYTGDMANSPGVGAVVEVKNGSYGGSYELALEDGRKFNVAATSFDKGIGCRFYVEPGLADANEIAGLLANAAIVAAKKAEAETAAKEAYAAEVARLKVEYAYLEQGDGPVVAAKNLRKLLKDAFPGIKFSVRSRSFAGGNAIDVEWTDGPTSGQVDAIADRFEAGKFDGMTDYYNYEPEAWNTIFGSAKYVRTRRNYSDALIGTAIAELAEEYAPTAAPTVEDYRAGNAWNVSPIEGGSYGRDNWQSLINEKCSGMEG